MSLIYVCALDYGPNMCVRIIMVLIMEEAVLVIVLYLQIYIMPQTILSTHLNKMSLAVKTTHKFPRVRAPGKEFKRFKTSSG